MQRFAEVAARALNTALENPIQSADLELPPDPKLGDFGFPCFRLAKQMRKAPPQIAQEITAAVREKGAAILAEAEMEVVAVGPYVNFRVPAHRVTGTVLGDILAGTGLGDYGRAEPRSRGRWILEYSSPNIAKPFMIGHLRTTAIGAALDRTARYRGYDVISINHLGDWGTQYGKLAVAIERYGLPADPKIKDLVDIYVKFHDEVEKMPELEDQARDAFRRLEKGDPEMTALWKKCVDISMKEFNRTYERLGVSFDHVWGESHYRGRIEPLIQDLREKNLLVESEGAWVIPVTDENGNEIPPCIVQKTDGATIYATRDLAAALYRWEKFKFDRMSYVVGGEQKLHFQQLFAALKKMGCDWVDRCEHVGYGLYRFKGAKMSTRKGNFVTLQDVLDTAKEAVAELMRERAAQKGGTAGDDGDRPGGLDEVTEAIALGAVVFNDLSSDPIRGVDFDVDRVVDFEGETGPYLQYAHTRCQSIIRKARESGELESEAPAFNAEWVKKLEKPEEIALVKTLGRLPLNLDRLLDFRKPSQLCHYLIDVTKDFGAFYRECHVLGQGEELTGARLMLVEATRRVLARGLTLLGIPLPERM